MRAIAHRRCRASRLQFVIINRGFNDKDGFSLHEELVDDIACPRCGEDTEVANLGFNNCAYKYKAKVEGGEKIETNWTRIGDNYHEPAEGSGDANYLKLRIFVKH